MYLCASRAGSARRSLASTLAELADTEPAIITREMRVLTAQGFVTASPDPSDGRASLVFLTERARGFRPVAEATLAELERLLVETLSTRGRDELREALLLLADL